MITCLGIRVTQFADYVLIRETEGVYKIEKCREGFEGNVYERSLFKKLSEGYRVIIIEKHGQVYYCNYLDLLNEQLNNEEKRRLKKNLRRSDRGKIKINNTKLKDLSTGDFFHPENAPEECFKVLGFRENNKCIIEDYRGLRYEKDSDMLVIKEQDGSIGKCLK